MRLMLLQLQSECHHVCAYMDEPSSTCHRRSSKQAYVKYAAILNLLINVSHAGQRGAVQFMVCYIQHVSIWVMV